MVMLTAFYPLDPNVDTEIAPGRATAFYPLDPNVDTEIVVFKRVLRKKNILSTPSIQTWILKYNTDTKILLVDHHLSTPSIQTWILKSQCRLVSFDCFGLSTPSIQTWILKCEGR